MTEAASAGMHLPPNWAQRLLAVVGAPPAPENIRLLTAWARAEGGTATWNPLNTTLVLPGSTVYNAAGVRNYPHATWGVCATAMTLTGGGYPGILGALQAAQLTAEEIVARHEAEFSHWGTTPTLILAILAGL